MNRKSKQTIMDPYIMELESYLFKAGFDLSHDAVADYVKRVSSFRHEEPILFALRYADEENCVLDMQEENYTFEERLHHLGFRPEIQAAILQARPPLLNDDGLHVDQWIRSALVPQNKD